MEHTRKWLVISSRDTKTDRCMPDFNDLGSDGGAPNLWLPLACLIMSYTRRLIRVAFMAASSASDTAICPGGARTSTETSDASSLSSLGVQAACRQ